MILPFKIRIIKGSFTMVLPKAIGFDLGLDKKFKVNKTVGLIAETTENGVLLRYPIEEEIERFNIDRVSVLNE